MPTCIFQLFLYHISAASSSTCSRLALHKFDLLTRTLSILELELELLPELELLKLELLELVSVPTLMASVLVALKVLVLVLPTATMWELQCLTASTFLRLEVILTKCERLSDCDRSRNRQQSKRHYPVAQQLAK